MKKSILLILVLAVFLTVCAHSLAETAPVLLLNEAALTLAAGKTVKLTPSAQNVRNPKKLKYTWESSDETVAAVSNGTVKGLDAGKAVVTCSTVLEDGTALAASAEIMVIIPVRNLKMEDKGPLTLNTGESRRIACVFSPENATDRSLEWTSSNPDIAFINKLGGVTARSAGTATITAATKDGSNKKAQIKVYVPSMLCGEEAVSVTDPAGAGFSFVYCGSDWDKNVSVKKKGDCFDYAITRNGTEASVQILPLSTGTGSLAVSDKKDPKSRFSVDITVGDTAVPLSRYALITDLRTNKNRFTVQFRNHSGREITEIGFYIIPYNFFFERMYRSGEVGEETVYYEWTGSLKPDAAVSYKGDFGSYENVDHIDLAVYQIRMADGQTIYFADNDQCWYSSDLNKYKTRPDPAVTSVYPSEEEIRGKGTVHIGYTRKTVRLIHARHYGYRNAGEYIEATEEGSPADRAGLRAKDLIIAADGILLADDPFALDKAEARIAGGGSFTVTVERPGQDETAELVITKE